MNKTRLDHDLIFRLWREGYSIDYITRAVGSIDPGYIRGLIQRKFGKISERRIDGMQPPPSLASRAASKKKMREKP